VKDQEIVDRGTRVTDRLGKSIRGLHGKPRAKQSGIKRGVATCDRARRGMPDHLADAKIFKKIAGAVFRHRRSISLLWHRGFAFHSPVEAFGKAARRVAGGMSCGRAVFTHA
jgi:hypothetical protein